MNQQQQSVLLQTASRFPPPPGWYIHNQFTNFTLHKLFTCLMFSMTNWLIDRCQVFLWHIWFQSRSVTTGIHRVPDRDTCGYPVDPDRLRHRSDDHRFPQPGLRQRDQGRRSFWRNAHSDLGALCRWARQCTWCGNASEGSLNVIILHFTCQRTCGVIDIRWNLLSSEFVDRNRW